MQYREKMQRAETKVLGAGLIEAVLSDESDDRDGDVIRQAGWLLDHFNRHPVMLASHNYMSLRAQIGEWEDMAVKGKRLLGVGRYYVGQGNEDADWAFNLASKSRAAYSVGFIPVEWEVREGGNDFMGPFEFTKQELLEVSQVTIPSNRNALQRLVKGGLDLDPVILDLLGEDGKQSVAVSQFPIGRFIVIDTLEEKPYPNEHSCRLRDPGDFQEGSFRRVAREHEGKKYFIIMGRLQGETTMTEQAYRYPKDTWSASEARKHCKDHDGQRFEPAEGTSSVEGCSDAGEQSNPIAEAIRQGSREALQELGGRL